MVRGFHRVFIYLLFLFICLGCFQPFAGAAIYYVSAAGNDDNDGLSEQTPFRTIDKLNSLIYSAEDNDTVLFRRGDLFRGEIRSSRYQPGMTFGAYGTGEYPVISGSMEIGGWVQTPGTDDDENVYMADVLGQLPEGREISHLFVNNKRALIARYPNVDSPDPDPDAGWLEVGPEVSASNNRTFVDPMLAAYGKPDNYWNGGTLRIRTFSWLFETRTIADSSDEGKITLSEDLSETLSDHIQEGWGYYLEDILAELDYPNEWYFDPVEHKVYLYAPGGVDPNTLLVEGSVYDYGGYFNYHYHNIAIEDLTFRHQAVDGIFIGQSNGFVVRNCRFENIGSIGINMAWNSADTIFENNTISDILDFGIKVVASESEQFPAGNSIIENNTLRNIGMVAGYGGSGSAHACGIRTYGIRGLTIRENTIENVGYAGMHLEGGGHLAENNIITRSMLTLDDGGGIFVNGPDMTIRGNIVTDTWGNRGPSSGLNNGSSFDQNQMGMGIFFMPNRYRTVVEDNTFADNRSHGIYADRARDATISGNVCYNNGTGGWRGSQLYLTGSSGTDHNVAITANTLVSVIEKQHALRTDTSYNIGTYNNDVNCNLETEQSIRDGSADLTLAAWQSTGRDIDATGCPLVLPSVSRILINRGESARTYYLGSTDYYNAKGTPVGPDIIVAPYRSEIIFQQVSDFYSLKKLIWVLRILTGQVGPDLQVVDMDFNGRIDTADALFLLNRLED